MVITLACTQLLGTSSWSSTQSKMSEERTTCPTQPHLNTSAITPYGPGNFEFLICAMAVLTSSIAGGSYISWHWRKTARSTMNEWLTEFAELSSIQKYFAHLLSIPCSSLMSIYPSADRSDAEAFLCDPRTSLMGAYNSSAQLLFTKFCISLPLKSVLHAFCIYLSSLCTSALKQIHLSLEAVVGFANIASCARFFLSIIVLISLLFSLKPVSDPLI